MFDYNMIVLGRLKHEEAVDGGRESYVPLSDRFAFVRRLLAVLRGSGQALQSARRGESHKARAGAVAK
jgi:hypothetical protein